MPAPSPPDDDKPQPVANVGFKAGLLLAVLALLVVGSVLFLLYARGAFELTQRLTLVADDSEGVVVGMDLTFAGFPIGRVRSVELGDDGKAHIHVDVPKKDAHWLKQSSVFTLVRGLVGNTNIRAFSGILTDPPLPDGAVRTVLRGDSSDEIPKLVAAARDLVANLTALTAAEGALAQSLANLRTTTERLNGPRGALGVVFGNERDAQRVVATVERTQALLARLDAAVARADAAVARADAQVFGANGVMPEVRDTVAQLKGLLTDTRASLKKVDAILDDAQAISGNAKSATADLGALRTDVEANLRKIEGLVNELNRKWPFAREVEIELP